MQTQPTAISSIIHQIAEQARLQPDAIAIHSSNTDLSYRAFYTKAEHLAEYLRRKAPISGKTVAICFERSADWVVAALAIMRAGGAYVPLDPTWPEARIRYAIEHSGAVALVARASMLNRLQLNMPGIDPCRDAAAIAKTPGNTDCDVSAKTLAYVIYTSGSTGVPKGVEITHENFANLVKWHHEAFGVSAKDRASHLAGLGFDASAWEIWPSLCAGATLYIPDEMVLSSPDFVRDWMLSEGITIGFVPSIYAAAMMEMEWPASTALRFLLTGGDVLHQGPAKQLPFAVVNNYGPTECTVVATSTVLKTGDTETPSIGKPITGTTIYLLDENQKEVTAGAPGEIYIGGDKVARGYRNQPELTNERFIKDPFASTPDARLYRTGDRGALRPDGQIQFLGRVDRQVKIRGKRLELDEVGSVLSRHPSVSFATAVALSEPSKADKRLVAYVVFKPEFAAGEEELVTYLSHHLPDYMIPVAFVQLPQIPLSSSGKLDFAALPFPSEANLLQSAPKEKPVTLIEQKLFDIIQNLLHGKSIGVNDNVFLVGGDSLLGMQLIIELKDKFGIELRFDEIFEAATIKDLARIIEEMRTSDQTKNDVSAGARNDSLQKKESRLPTGVVSLQKATSDKLLFWVHYLNVNLDKALGQNRPMTFLMLTPEDMAALGAQPTLKNVAAKMVKKIEMMQPNGPYTIGGYCLGAVLSYEIAAQLQKAGHVVDLLIMVDAPSPSYFKMKDPFGIRFKNPGYIIKRFKKLGLRTSLNKLGNRIVERSRRKFAPETAKPEIHPGQSLIEGAASDYKGEAYNGKVLLFLGSENPPHVNFLPEWQGLVPNDLHYKYIAAHHYELMAPPHVQGIAETIVTHLESTSKTLPKPASSDIVSMSPLREDESLEGVEERNLAGVVSEFASQNAGGAQLAPEGK
jgi:amino acid adenylation domain-containing protein